MKEVKETDRFKEIIKGKIPVKELSTPEDTALWKAVLEGIQKEKTPVRKIFSPYWYAVAASLLIFAASAAFVYFNSKTTPEVLPPLAKTVDSAFTQQTAVKQTEVTPVKTEKENGFSETNTRKSPSKIPDLFKSSETISASNNILYHLLSDNSLVTMKSGSRISISETYSKNRTLRLEGEAYFAVKKDSTKPFNVYFDQYQLVVLGTKFNISNPGADSAKRVTVTEGLVKVIDKNGGSENLVKPGEQLILSKNSAKIIHLNADDEVAWKLKIMNFKNAKLKEICSILSAEFDKELIIEDNIKNCRFNGDLSGLSFEEAVEIISITNSLTINQKDNIFLLSGKGCE